MQSFKPLLLHSWKFSAINYCTRKYILVFYDTDSHKVTDYTEGRQVVTHFQIF